MLPPGQFLVGRESKSELQCKNILKKHINDVLVLQLQFNLREIVTNGAGGIYEVSHLNTDSVLSFYDVI